MKTITLIRHAKSSWKNPDLQDIDRPLNARGKRDAPLMGKRLRKMKIKPDLLISSPARRALKTARIIAKAIGYPKKRIQVLDSVYHGNADQLMKVLQDIDERVDHVCLFGHNPDMTFLANGLCNQSIENIPTCGVVGIACDIPSWKQVKMGTGSLIFFDYPKKHL